MESSRMTLENHEKRVGNILSILIGVGSDVMKLTSGNKSLINDFNNLIGYLVTSASWDGGCVDLVE